MASHIGRRRFLGMAMLGVAGSRLSSRLCASESSPLGHATPIGVSPFELSSVRLRAGPVLAALETNKRYLMDLDPQRLLHTFRITAGLPSSAQPLGGWEAPDNELRGHFTGHYLSACALLGAQTGDSRVRERGKMVAAELAKCQISTGYLSAFPDELFDRLRAGKPVWAPFYTLHKLMAGLLDTHTLSNDEQALTTLLGMARWTEHWVQPLDDQAMARVLEREYGGMNEVLYNLGSVTGDRRWLDLAHRFDKERIFTPLAAGQDVLQGLHCNTTVPQIIGAARGFELTGAPQLHDAADFFWHAVTERRAYCTGGTSNNESWNAPPGRLAHELSGYTQECCVTYNMQKLTRHLFSWSGDARLADYYERTFYNGILGVQHPRDGEKLYYVPLQSGYWKLFGSPLQDFWCCTGSMAESFAKLGDSIYFHDDSDVYVNLFVPSELSWEDRGLHISLDTRFPETDTVRLTVRTPQPTKMALRIRIPYWTRDAQARVNGHVIPGRAQPGSYLVIERAWTAGDEVTLRVPMSLHVARMPDDPTIQAVMYGPLVLAGRLGTTGLDAATLRAEPTKPRAVPEYKRDPVPAPVITAPADDPASWLEPVPGRALEFRTKHQKIQLTLVPLNQVFDERYAVYWQIVARPA